MPCVGSGHAGGTVIDITFNPGQLIGPFGKLFEDETTYRGNPAIGSTDLNTFRKSPALYHGLKTGEFKQPDGDHFLVGRAAHCLILEPDDFDKRYMKNPGLDRRKKADAEEHNRIVASGIGVLSLDNWRDVHRMAESVKSNPIASEILFASENEVSWRTEYMNLGVQCRSDIWSDRHIGDLKTAESLGKFSRSFHDMGYWLQAWLYSYIVAKVAQCRPKFTFIVVEKSPPYAVGTFQMDDAYLKYAQEKTEATLERFSECLNTGVWPRDKMDTAALSLPKWSS